jgi:3-methylcrotonyl-CoA carboxylase alpha subunit
LSSPYAINLGNPSAYLDGDKIIEVAKKNGCNGIHPGYGFLSENSAFARRCTEAGIVFIGPPWEAIEAMGNKSRSKEIMIEAGVPCIPGYHGSNQDPAFLKAEAEKIGYPVLLKAVKGGGGKGMRIAATPEVFLEQLESAKSEARSSFGDDVMLVEKYITTPRHIEVQIFADKHGNCVALGERDCSIQRRHQKVIEESPAPHLEEAIRQDLWEKARAAALAVGYEGAGTVEFIFDNETREFFFMEMNTRLQVEHPVTEMVTGEDLVHWQLIVAQGGKLPLTQEQIADRIQSRGWGIEARIYAENPKLYITFFFPSFQTILKVSKLIQHRDFIPDSGTLTHLKLPTTNEDIRVDAGFIVGDEVSSFYDPMIAKLIVRGENRTEAIRKLHAALTNIEFIKRVCETPAFISGDVETGFIKKHEAELLKDLILPAEIFAQAAIGLISHESINPSTNPLNNIGDIGFTDTFQTREFQFLQTSTLPLGSSAHNNNNTTTTKVSLTRSENQTYTISITNNSSSSNTTTTTSQTFPNIHSTWTSNTKTLTSFFPHTRLDTRVLISDPANSNNNAITITLFSHGQQYILSHPAPAYLQKALGINAASENSVLAPMPCKILRVHVSAGQTVHKDQPLVVIESMKMETVIRSPADGVVRRVVHGEGVCLLLFFFLYNPFSSFFFFIYNFQSF